MLKASVSEYLLFQEFRQAICDNKDKRLFLSELVTIGVD